MDISSLSARYKAVLAEEEHISDILELCSGNPKFYQHCPPSPSHETIAQDMRALPEGKTYEDKYYIVFFDGEALVAVLDLIVKYPNDQTAFIGFFMMHASRQHKGAASELIREIFACLKQDYRFVRLGFVEGNEQSEHFWMKHGFERTGVIVPTPDYRIVVLEKAL